MNGYNVLVYTVFLFVCLFSSSDIYVFFVTYILFVVVLLSIDLFFLHFFFFFYMYFSSKEHQKNQSQFDSIPNILFYSQFCHITIYTHYTFSDSSPNQYSRHFISLLQIAKTNRFCSHKKTTTAVFVCWHTVVTAS